MDSVARTKANNRLHDCYINLYKTMIKLKNITQVEDIKQTEQLVSGCPVTHSAVHSLRARSSETERQREKSYETEIRE